MMHSLATKAVMLTKQSNILNVVAQNVLALLSRLVLIIVLRDIFQICYIMGTYIYIYVYVYIWYICIYLIYLEIYKIIHNDIKL